MNSIEGILKLADAEFEAIVKNGKFRSREEIDSVYKLMDIVKDAHCIWQYEDEEESGYSEGGSYRGMYGDGSYDGGMSGARGRGRGANRYADGRYAPTSRRSYDGGSYRGRGMNYSRGDGRQEYIDNLRDMMADAPDDQTRQSIQRMIQQMEQQV